MNEDLQKQALIRSLLFSSLLVGEMKGASPFDLELLDLPAELPEINFQQKLGHVYEDALEILLEHSERIKLLAKSLQIFNEKRITLGELDYLLEHDGQAYHLELAVKFYMVYYEEGVACFPGPDPSDNWLNKLERLEVHQLKMAQNEYAQELLLANYGVRDVEVKHLIYGRLYDHIAEKRRPLPRGMSATAQRSIWLYVDEWEEYFSAREAVYMIPKTLWPVDPGEYHAELLESLRSLCVEELRDEILLNGRCELVYHASWAAPVFVVPASWPDERAAR